MKKLVISLGLIAFSFGLFGVQVSFAAGKVVGQLGSVEGEVWVDTKPVQKSAPVREGSVVEVKKGHATLLLGKGSVFNLAADSKIVVSQFMEKTDTNEEGAELDLKFGRTRALILNEGKEKKDIRIKARAATMGVRGTEIFIDAPKDSGKPIQFFTLEGKAEVTAHPGAPVVPVAQNHGVTASGVSPTANTGGGEGPNAKTEGSGKGNATGSGPGVSAATAQAGAAGSGTAVSSMTVSELKAEIKKAGLDVAGGPGLLNGAPRPPPPGAAPPGSLSGSLSIGSLIPIQYDPVQDRMPFILSIGPKFCNASTGVSCK